MIHPETSLARTEFLDYDAPEVRAFVADCPADRVTPTERAVWLYYAVRDRIRYEVYGADLSRTGLRASRVLRAGSGMCLHKSVVYVAGLRAFGIPSKLVLTDVRNHIASERLISLLGGHDFHQHALTTVQLHDRWVRATPVFNRTLCRLYGITELDFDGTADSVHHPYDRQHRLHMEFLREHGEFDDLPYEFVVESLRRHHPRLFESRTRLTTGSLTRETGQ